MSTRAQGIFKAADAKRLEYADSSAHGYEAKSGYLAGQIEALCAEIEDQQRRIVTLMWQLDSALQDVEPATEPEPDLFDEPSEWAIARAEDLFIAERDAANQAREAA